MRLVCLNVAVFEKNNAGVADFLAAQHPDIVCLQEVTRGVGPKVDPGYVSLEAVNAALPDLPHSFYGPLWVTKDFWCNNFHGHERFEISYGDWLEFGLLVKSRYPIRYGELPFVQGSFAMRSDWSSWPEDDSRAVQSVDLVIGDGTNLRIVNYHGVWTKDKRGNDKTLAANRRVREAAESAPGAAIICGDFNLFPDTPSMGVFAGEFESLTDTFGITTTRPKTNELSGLGRNVIDYVLVKGLKATAFSVPETDISDHLPLIADFG
jgi:endonuclease/exonuclease/phosphatase family metal-dependent hydrolase